MTKAYFGAGCFWGIEETFRKIKNVQATSVGYGGGQQENPTYSQVCGGRTGHAELVEITYEPSQLSYQELLKTFWQCHDPTQQNRQGPDIGTQYRSVIYHTDQTQATTAESSKLELQKKLGGNSIATQIEPFKNYYLAEDYHQQYIAKRKG